MMAKYATYKRKGERFTMAVKKATKAAPVVEDEVEDFEEVEDTEEVIETPAAPEPEIFGVRQLIALAKSKFGKEYTPREVRILLRKLAREGGGVNREIIPGNKSRYQWTGPQDPEVRAVLKAIKAGSIEQAKTDALNKLKADNAAKAAAKKAAAETAAPAKKKAAAAAPPVDDDDEDEDED